MDRSIKYQVAKQLINRSGILYFNARVRHLLFIMIMNRKWQTIEIKVAYRYGKRNTQRLEDENREEKEIDVH